MVCVVCEKVTIVLVELHVFVLFVKVQLYKLSCFKLWCNVESFGIFFTRFDVDNKVLLVAWDVCVWRSTRSLLMMS